MLHYLAASLPAHTTPGARLVALQAVLRASALSSVRLPHGLILGIGQGPAESVWDQLVAARFITPNSAHGAAYTGWLTDPLSCMPNRGTRLRAADWAMRAARRGRAQGLSPAGQLVTVCLGALLPPMKDEGIADSMQLARLCGLTDASLPDELDRLVEARVLMCWSKTRHGDETAWWLA
ncbi:hypothetical protein ACWGI1_01625 [Streptomyces sp. NPDC054835]